MLGQSVSQTVNCQKSCDTEWKKLISHLPSKQPMKRQTVSCFLCYGIAFHRQAVGRSCASPFWKDST